MEGTEQDIGESMHSLICHENESKKVNKLKHELWPFGLSLFDKISDLLKITKS